jgi:hypothetical protein
MDKASNQERHNLNMQAQLYNLYRQRQSLNSEYEPTLSTEKKGKATSKTESKAQSKTQNQKENTSEKNTPKKENIPGKNKIFVTEIVALDATDGGLKNFAGPHIIASDEEEAEFLCQNTGLGYCRIIGELVGLIDGNGNDVKDAYKLN